MAKKAQGAEEIQGEQVELQDGIGEGVQVDGQGLEPVATIPDDDADADPHQQDDAEEAPQLVKMYRDIDFDDDGPEEADVHPEEVANYSAAGWIVSDE